MNKTLQDLYYGRISPMTKAVPPDTELARLMAATADSEDTLIELLSQKLDEKKLLASLSDAYRAMIAQTAEERFIEGFRLGARMAIEIMLKDDSTLPNE